MNAPAREPRTAATLALLATVLICASNAIAQTATPTALVLDYDQTVIPDLEPGDYKTIYIVVSNTGGLPAGDVRASLSSVGSLAVQSSQNIVERDGERISVGGFWELGTINAAGSARFATSIRVGENARPGTHYLPLSLTYDERSYDLSGSLVQEEVTTRWLIPVEVSADSLLELADYTIDTQELRPADNVELSLTLENTAESDAVDVTALLGESGSSITDTFTVIGATEKKLGTIGKDETGRVAFTIHIDEDAEAQAYTLPFTVTYEDKSRTEHTDVFYIGVYVAGDRKLAITNFESDPAEIHADDEDVEFTGHIENQGTEQVKNVKVTFQPGYPLTNARSFVQTKEAGTIAGGASTSFTFYADVADDIEPQATNVSFLLEYEVNSQPYTDEVSFVVDILENPKFALVSEAPPTAPGQEGQAQVTVENQGALCESVTLIVLEKSDQPFSFNEKSAYIGDLDRGETGVATIVYEVEEDAPAQPHLVPVEVRCTKDDDVLIYDKTVKLEVAEAGATGGSQTTLIAVLAVVVIGALLWGMRNSKGKGKE